MHALFVFSNNMEDIESIGTRGLLKRAGFDVTTTTFNESTLLTTKFDQEIKVDTLGDSINVNDYDFLVIPGGPYVKETVDADTKVKTLAKSFSDANKPIAAICAGPRFLGQAGLLDGKRYTAFTGSDKDAPNGIYDPSKKAMREGNLITARGAGAVYAFVYEIVKYLKDEASADQLMESILY